LAHDLLIDVTNFKANVNVPEEGFSAGNLDLELQTNSLKVICALKEGERQPDTLKEKDIADIERDMAKKVLHPDKYPTVNFCSKGIQEKEGGYQLNGELMLHSVTKSNLFFFCHTKVLSEIYNPQSDIAKIYFE